MFNLPQQQQESAFPNFFIPQVQPQQPQHINFNPLSVLSTNSVFEVNVGGIEYVTSTETIQKIPKIATEYNSTVQETNGKRFIDRDGSVFKYILNFVRSNHNEAYLPTDLTTLEQLLCEAEYYNITKLVQAVTTKIQSLSTRNTTTKVNGSGMRLIKFARRKTNRDILISEDPAKPFQQPQVIADSQVQFILTPDEKQKKGRHVLIKWYIASAAGIYAVQLDGDEKQRYLVGGSGVKLNQAAGDVFISYMHTGIIQFARYFECDKPHSVVLLWKSYEASGYVVNGPIMIEVYEIDDTQVEVVVDHKKLGDYHPSTPPQVRTKEKRPATPNAAATTGAAVAPAAASVGASLAPSLVDLSAFSPLLHEK